MDEHAKYILCERIDNGFIITKEYWDDRVEKKHHAHQDGALLDVSDSLDALLPLSGVISRVPEPTKKKKKAPEPEEVEDDEGADL